jgi:filamentous hemagglutinin family protein
MLFFNMPRPAAAEDPVPGMIEGYNVVHGTAPYNTVGNTTTFTTGGASTIIEYSRFNIDGGKTVHFAQPTTSAATLNRIIEANPSLINGTLSSNGQIFMVNPAGVIFGAGSSVNVARLVASTLDITNNDFLGLDGSVTQHEFFDTAVTGEFADTIINSGTITAQEGVALLAKKVTNSGAIMTNAGGFVVMTAGDRVLLGEPGSNIVVELDSATGDAEGTGDVINDSDGEITAPAGQVVLAAGDIFSAALDPVVHGGSGKVVQDGTINVDGDTGDGGTVSLTAGDEVVLGPDSLTKANAVADGTGEDRPVGGKVVISSPETVTCDPDARIEAKGNGIFDAADNRRFDIDDDIDFRGSIQVTGSYITPPMDVDLESWDSEFAGLLTIGPYTDDLILANGALPADPAQNTIYEEWIEGQSSLGVNVDLLSPGDIIAETLSGGGDTGLQGDNGDLSFRTKFDNGAITFDTADLISTDNGGNIFMQAGSGGITVGDMMTEVAPSDKVTDPGQIFLLTARPETAEDGGDITTGSMVVEGGSKVEISAIAAGTLTVNGDVISKTNQVPGEDQTVGKALICLIADEDVIVNNADVIAVNAHGKQETNADICISAGWNVDIANPLTSDASAVITAEAKTSENNPGNSAAVDIVIHAGWNLENPGTDSGTISINGINYDGSPGGDNSDLPISAKASVSGTGSAAETDTSDTPSEDDPRNDNDDGSSKLWTDENKDGSATVSIEMDNSEEDPPTDEDSPCYDCPKPPFLPPIPVFTVEDLGSGHMGDPITGNVLDNDTTPADGLTVIGHTQPSNGSVTVDEDGNYEYTPDPGFVGQDTFTYTVSNNGTTATETVTVTVTNALPTATGDDVDAHMGDTISGSLEFQDQPDPDAGGAIEELTELIVQVDSTLLAVGDSVTISTTLAGEVTFTRESDGTISYEYTGPAGLAGTTDSFSFSVSDGQQGEDPATATILIDLTNATPTANGDNVDAHMGSTIGGSLDFFDNADGLGGFEDLTELLVQVDSTLLAVGDSVTIGTTLGGEVTFTRESDGTISYEYTGPAGLAGTTDSFSFSVSDGQLGADPATALINIALNNLPPVAVDDSATTSVGSPVGGNVLNNDFDQDFPDFVDPISIDSYTNPTEGTLDFNPDTGEFVYTPEAGFVGEVTFTYIISDGQIEGETSEATVTITVSPLPPPPVPLEAAPLPPMIVWEVAGCPSLEGWLAGELGVDVETIQVHILHAYSEAEGAVGNKTAIAYKAAIQSCATCARLKDAAAVLADPNSTAALVAVVPPPEQPITDEMFDNIMQLFADAAEGSDYATARDYAEAFAQYVAALDDLGRPVGEPSEFAMGKYVESDNPNVGAFLGMLLETGP